MSVSKLFQSRIAEFIVICSSKRNFIMERLVVASGISSVRKVIWD